MEVLGWFHQGPSVEQNLGEVVSVPGDRGIPGGSFTGGTSTSKTPSQSAAKMAVNKPPDLRSSVSAFPFHRGRRPRCGVRGRRPHRPGHSRPPTAAPETPGGRGASEPSPVTPAETRGETGVMVGIWGSSQTRVWVALPVSRKLPRDAPSSTARRTTSHTGARSAARRPGRSLKPGQSLWAGPQGAHRAWRADPCAVLRMVRPSCWPAPANPKID